MRHSLLVVLVPLACGDDPSPAVDAGARDAVGDVVVADRPVTDTATADGRVDDVPIADVTPADVPAAPDAAPPDASPLDASLVDSERPDAAPTHACKAIGGICIGASQPCEASGGRHDAAGDAACAFDDGPGLCCVPPAPQSEGTTCVARGGVCAPIAGCNDVDGAFAPSSDCTGVPIVCCVPETRCGVEDVVCCGPGSDADFRPQCDRGTFRCDAFPGTTLVPITQCPQ